MCQSEGASIVLSSLECSEKADSGILGSGQQNHMFKADNSSIFILTSPHSSRDRMFVLRSQSKYHSTLDKAQFYGFVSLFPKIQSFSEYFFT